MNTLDFSPLYRTTIGFDHVSNLLNTVNRTDSNTNGYPHYNIELFDTDQYRITMAVAGFIESELDIKTEKQLLTVKGNRQSPEEIARNYLHQGIAARNFERRFQLADHVKVIQAHLENGLLHIDLAREIPEAMKPKSISIETNKSKVIDINTVNAPEQQDAA